MGIEPTNPSLARRFIGFEDRGQHQSSARFHGRRYTEKTARSARRLDRPVRRDGQGGDRDYGGELERPV